MMTTSSTNTTQSEKAKQTWIGLLGVEPVDGCEVFNGDDVAGAYVYFVVAAHDGDEFRAIANDMSQRVKLNVHEFSEVMPWNNWTRTATKVDDYLNERAKETQNDGQPRFGEFHRYLKRDETMN